MHLYIAGINHNDPSCRTRLVAWLASLSATNSGAPSFVAVEAAADASAVLVPQRLMFRRLLIEEFPALHPEVLDILEASLYYESDAHTKIYGGVPTVWLDVVDKSRADSLGEYAKVRMKMYRPFLSSEDVLLQIARWAWHVADWRQPPTNEVGNVDYRRDQRLFDLIIGAIRSWAGQWAVAIVGASHAADRPNSTRILLERAGVQCAVKILEPP